MSTTTLGLGARLFGASQTEAKSKKGIFARMLDRAIAAREAEARLKAAEYMNYISDRRLLEIGMNAQDIQLMRDTGRVPPTIWS